MTNEELTKQADDLLFLVTSDDVLKDSEKRRADIERQARKVLPEFIDRFTQIKLAAEGALFVFEKADADESLRRKSISELQAALKGEMYYLKKML